MRLRFALGVTLLAAQIVMIAVARFHPMRYFCWAPYDSQIEYSISAHLDGRALSPSEIKDRYGLAAESINPRMICQVTDVISYAERRYYPDVQAEVCVSYRVNGKGPQEWLWPPQPSR